MQRILKRLATFFLVMMIIDNGFNKVCAQTPIDIPGGGSAPGTVATSGDGPAEVPFDGSMSLLLLASGIGYASMKIKRIVVSC